MSNDWSRNSSPPPPTFLNEPERNFQKQITDEVLEKVIGQQIIYFPIDMQSTNIHPLYKESINKSYLPGIRVYALVDFDDDNVKTTSIGKDRRSKITVYFHNKRIKDDQELYVREGDVIFYNNEYHEIKKMTEPNRLFDQINFKVEIKAECVKIRNGINLK